jgi:class 3 adenylate cyclase
MKPNLRSSEDRLWSLIEQRTHPDADIAAIDARIWDLFGQEWAVMFTDLSGFSRHTSEFGITHFLQIIWEQRKHLDPVIERCDGILVKSEADSQLILFKRADVAMRCALEMMATCSLINRRRREEEQILLCIGIGFGKILRVGDSDVFGQQVNAASKLGEDTAKAGQILVTDAFKTAEAGAVIRNYEPLAVEVAGSAVNWSALYEEAAPPSLQRIGAAGVAR